MAIVNLSALLATIQQAQEYQKEWMVLPKMQELLHAMEAQELQHVPFYRQLQQEIETIDRHYNHMDEHALFKLLFELIDKAPDFTHEFRIVETHYFDDDQEPWTCFSFEGDYGSAFAAINDAISEHDTAFHHHDDKDTIELFHQMQRAESPKALYYLLRKVW